MRRAALLLLLFAVACDSNDAPGDSLSGAGTENTGGTETSSATGGTTTDDGGTGSGESGVGGEDSSSDGGDPLPTPTGPQLYASLCSGCHGLEAEGTELGYELRHPDRGLATHVIRTGRPGVEFEDSEMAAYAEDVFSDAQLDELFDWLDSFEQPADGAGLYADYCANCHGADPLGGGIVDQDIEDKGLSDTLEKVREGAGGSFEPRGDYMSSFTEAQLSDAEVQAIIDWI